MAKDTARGRVWQWAMKQTHRDGNAITPRKLAQMADVSERSARDVLSTMDHYGILEREQNGRNVRYLPHWEDL